MTRILKIIFTLPCILLAAGALMATDDKPSVQVEWYGDLRLDASRDQNPTNNGNYVMYVSPLAPGGDHPQMNITANQSRFGMKLTGSGYGNTTLTGNLEFDLYASLTGVKVPENKGMFQLRHAFITIAHGKFKFLAGQTWDLLAPLIPQTLNYPVLGGAGNIGHRHPQLDLFYIAKPVEKTEITFGIGAFRTLGCDLTPNLPLAEGETADKIDDGVNSGLPSVQGICEYKREFASGSTIRFGASGLWGRLKAGTSLGQEQNYETWAAAGHFTFVTASDYGIMLETFTGSNLNAYYGGVVNSDSINGLKAYGGWVQVWGRVHPKWKLSAGYGLDNPDDDLVALKDRSKNQVVFGNVIYTLIPKVTLGLELSEWQTNYKGLPTANDFRIQTTTSLKF